MMMGASAIRLGKSSDPVYCHDKNGAERDCNEVKKDHFFDSPFVQLKNNRAKNGIADESYDTHYDSLNSEIWAKAKASEQWQKNGVDQIEELNAWRGTGDGWKIK